MNKTYQNKRIIIAPLIAICALIIAAQCWAEIKEFDKDTVIYGVKFPKGTDYWEEIKDGEKTWSIDSCRLIKPQKIRGINWSKGTVIKFYESGKYLEAIIPKQQKIQDIVWPESSTIQIDESGRIRKAGLNATKLKNSPLEIQGIKFGSSTYIDFDEEGKITHIMGMWGNPIVIQGKEWPDWSIWLARDGKVQKLIIGREMEIEGIKLDAYGSLEFYSSGKIKQAGPLSSAQEISGKKYEKGDTLEFNESGDVIQTIKK